MKILLLFLAVLLVVNVRAQNKEVELKDLAVPASPVFILLDASPSMFQTPNTPKAFVLGIAQSFQNASGGFPQDYSAEFAPYWWLKPSDRSIYSVMGIKTPDIHSTSGLLQKENPFSGLKFAAFSLGFFNKDMLPDASDKPQKVIAFGLRSTVVKIHQKNYAQLMQQKIADWHSEAQLEMDNNIELLTEISRHPENSEQLIKNFKPLKTGEIVTEINDLVNQKPLFAWNISASYANFGIGDSTWKTGRYGIWTGISTYLPFSFKKVQNPHNYFNLNLSLRYLADNFLLNNEGMMVKGNCVDIGGKVALEIEHLTFGVESVYRFANGSNEKQNKTVAILNYKIANNLYLVGSFGKNFNKPNKLISLFGINWGFGTEHVNMPES